MRNLITPFTTIAAMALLGACASDTGPDPSLSYGEGTGGLEILVAPWEADSRADYACYAVEVTGADGELVWSEESLCTDTWSLGPQGILSYVGICDASGDGVNSISIELTSLIADDGTELGNWADDSPPTYAVDFTCVANADTVVRANFLVITEGTKGFLDVQVSVDEIACNAKVDCHEEFLGGDAPVGTIVVALACDAGNDDFTQIMLDEIVCTCLDELGTEVVVSVDPAMGPGSYPGYPNAFVSGAIGNSGTSSDGTSFWTVAIGIAPGWTDCQLSTRMAANDGRDMEVNDQFPVILATDIAFGFDGDVFSCDANPLEGELSGLYTSWGTAGNLDFHACLNEDGSVSLCE